MKDMIYGIIPEEEWESAQDTNAPAERVKAISQMIQRLKAVREIEEIREYKKELLFFTFKLIDDYHGKIAVQGFILLGKLIEKIAKGYSEETLEHIIPKMIEKWGEPKQVIRHSTSAVMTKVITKILPPHQLSSCLIAQLNVQNSHVKEEMINFICYCLLKHPSCPYDYPEIVHGMCKSLKDSSIRVKIVSAETLAVVYRNIGDDLTPMLEPIKQSNMRSYQVLQKRLRQPILPMLSKTKGVIQHKLLNKINAQQYKRKRVQSAFRTNIPTNGLDGEKEDAEMIRRRHYRRRQLRAHSAPRRMQNDDELESYTRHGINTTTTSTNGIQINNRYAMMDPESDIQSMRSSSSTTSTLTSNITPNTQKNNRDQESRLPQIRENTSASSTRSKVSIWLQQSNPEQERKQSKRTFYPQELGTITPQSSIDSNHTTESSYTRTSQEFSLLKTSKNPPKITIPSSPQVSINQASPINAEAMTPSNRPKRLRVKRKIKEPRTPSNLESGLSPIGGAGAQLTHFATQDLEPSDSPQIELREALKQLASSVWDEQHHGVTSIRRLCAHHTQILMGHVTIITSYILKHINGLRSLLCKNAIVCIEDMFTYLKKHMDSSLTKSVPLLLKKSSDTNRFISTQAEKSLVSCVHNCSKEKILVSLSANLNHKNATIRQTCALVIHHIIMDGGKKLTKLKSFELIPTITIKFLTDSSAKCRSQARQMATALIENIRLHKNQSPDRYLMKILHSQSDVRKLMEASNQTAPTPATPSTPSNLREEIHGSYLTEKDAKHRKSTPKSPKPSKKLDTNVAETLADYYDDISTNDWRKRSQAMEDIANLVVTHAKRFSETDIAILFDHLLPRLSDSHIKVNAVAYGTLSKILPVVSHKLGTVRLRLFQAIVSGLNASSSRIKKHAKSALDECIAHSSHDAVLQIFPHMIKATTNVKIHIDLIGLMSLWMEKWFEEDTRLKKRTILRYLVPTTNKLYGKPTCPPTLKAACVDLIRVLYEEYGEDVLSHISNRLSQTDMATVRG